MSEKRKYEATFYNVRNSQQRILGLKNNDTEISWYTHSDIEGWKKKCHANPVDWISLLVVNQVTDWKNK